MYGISYKTVCAASEDSDQPAAHIRSPPEDHFFFVYQKSRQSGDSDKTARMWQS